MSAQKRTSRAAVSMSAHTRCCLARCLAIVSGEATEPIVAPTCRFSFVFVISSPPHHTYPRDDEAKGIASNAGCRIDMGKVLDAAYTYARSCAALNAALDDFAGNIGSLRLAEFSAVFSRRCVRVFLIGFINHATSDAGIQIR